MGVELLLKKKPLKHLLKKEVMILEVTIPKVVTLMKVVALKEGTLKAAATVVRVATAAVEKAAKVAVEKVAPVAIVVKEKEEKEALEERVEEKEAPEERVEEKVGVKAAVDLKEDLVVAPVRVVLLASPSLKYKSS